MAFLITRKPEKLFAGSIKFSRWTAAHNPYIFELRRYDFYIVNTAIRTAYSTTLPTILTSADPVTLPLFVYPGDEIYVNSGVYNGVYTVTAVNGQYITINTAYIGVGGSGWVNQVTRLINYRAFVNIYDGVTNELIDSVYPKPDSTGLLLCDVSGIIRSIIDTQFDANQTPINKANKGISGGFKIGYGATYLAVLPSLSVPVTIPETPTSPDTNTEIYYWVSAAKQITGDISDGMNGIGQNMKEYVPKNLSGSEAKFLTMFERPTYFEGFPFTLSFLYDDDFDVNYLERHQQDVDINGVNVGAETSTVLNVSERKYVNQMKIRTPNTGAKSFDVWLEVGDAIEDGYVVVGGLQVGSASAHANTSV